MKLKSRFHLGGCLLQQGTFYAPPTDRIAFLAGCVEPEVFRRFSIPAFSEAIETMSWEQPQKKKRFGR